MALADLPQARGAYSCIIDAEDGSVGLTMLCCHEEQ